MDTMETQGRQIVDLINSATPGVAASRSVNAAAGQTAPVDPSLGNNVDTLA